MYLRYFHVYQHTNSKLQNLTFLKTLNNKLCVTGIIQYCNKLHMWCWRYGFVFVSVSWFEWWWALWRSRALSHLSVCSSFILGKWITSKCLISHNVSFWLHHLAWNIISTDLEYVIVLFSNCVNIHLWAFCEQFWPVSSLEVVVLL